MKRISAHVIRTALLLIFVLNGTSCYKEDSSGCPRAFLRFTYTKNVDYVSKFKEQVNDLNLYFYDEQGRLSKHLKVASASLEGGDRLKLTMVDPGRYTVVAWGNYNTDEFRLAGTATLAQMKMHLLNIEGEVRRCTSLFHGVTELVIERDVVNEKVIDLTKDTNIIHVILENVVGARTAPNTDFSVRISGCNGIYDYDNSMAAECATLSLLYMPLYGSTAEPDEILSDFTVMRMFSDKRDKLKVTITDVQNPDTPVHSLWLTEEIMNAVPDIATDDDLDRNDEHTLRYKMEQNSDGTWAVISIFINNWELNSSTGGI